LIRRLVGVPLLSGVDEIHQRVGCVKPDDCQCKTSIDNPAVTAIAVPVFNPLGTHSHIGALRPLFFLQGETQ